MPDRPRKVRVVGHQQRLARSDHLSRHALVDTEADADQLIRHAVAGHHDRRPRVRLVAQHHHRALDPHDAAGLPREARQDLVDVPAAAHGHDDLVDRTGATRAPSVGAPRRPRSRVRQSQAPPRAGRRPAGRATTRPTAARTASPGPRGRGPTRPRRTVPACLLLPGVDRGRVIGRSSRVNRSGGWVACARVGERTSHPPGTFSWVDLSTSDLDGATAFYEGLLGWGHADNPIGDDAVYRMFELGGKHVAAASSSVTRSARTASRRTGTTT